MALKRRKIVQEDLDLGNGTSEIPSDAGGTQTGTQINIGSFPTPWTGTFTIMGSLTADDLITTDDLTVGDDLTVAGDAAVTGALTAGTVTAADLTSTDDVIVGDDLNVTGLATIGETLAVTGAATVGGTLTVTGVLTAPAATKAAAMSGGDATITVEQDLTGATVSLDKNGIWLVTTTFYMKIDASANAARCIGYLNVDGSNETPTAAFQLVSTGQSMAVTSTQVHIITISGQPKTAKLRAVRDTGTGSVVISDTLTTIRAIYLGSA